MAVERPFEELDRCDHVRLQPAAPLDVFGCQTLARSALSRLGKIPKRAFGDPQALEIREYRPSRSWREAVPNSARICRACVSVRKRRLFFRHLRE
jgi:hypothetical protein